MKRAKAASAFLVMIVGLGVAISSGCAKRINLVGTWKLNSMIIDGMERSTPKVYDTYKHITPEGFIWLSRDKDTGRIVRAAGGTYELKKGTYTEKIEYGIGNDYEVIRNTRPSFTAKIKGDTWHHIGKLENGQTIDEVWMRVKRGK
jgi:hypothetical protein